MRFLRTVWKALAELAGESQYSRYCAHLRTHHPERAVPSAKDFFLQRLEEKYKRPNRCC
ncbi:MAG: putative Selenoprotein [Acidobacteria bacterium]|nr:putative Selenoprotein [Acidobacteriota bacterium]